MTKIVFPPTRIVVTEPTPVPSWVTSMPLMTWAQIPNTRLDTVLYDPRGFTKKRALAQCGAALRKTNSEIFLMTGGHADGCSNAVYSIMLESETPTWRMRNQPTPTELIQTDVSHYLDGRPTSTHTGWTVQYNHRRDLFMRFGVTSAYGSGGFNAPHVDAFDPAIDDWLPKDTFPQCPIKPNMDRCTAQVGEDIYQQSEAGTALIVRWKDEDGPYGKWQSVGTGSVFQRGPNLLHDAARNRLVRFDRYRPVFLPLDTPDSIKPVAGPNYTGPLATEDITEFPRVMVPNIGSPFDGKWLFTEQGYHLYMKTERGQDVQIYQTDPETFENTLVSVAGTKPKFTTGMTGIIFGRFMLVEKFKMLVVVLREDQDIWCIKLAE